MSVKSFINGWFQDAKKSRGTTDLGEAMDWATNNRCCGVDCCEGVIYLTDKSTGVKRVLYSKNGTLLNVTEATYLADKAAGFA